MLYVRDDLEAGSGTSLPDTVRCAEHESRWKNLDGDVAWRMAIDTNELGPRSFSGAQTAPNNAYDFNQSSCSFCRYNWYIPISNAVINIIKAVDRTRCVISIRTAIEAVGKHARE
jgi:hypothetical protein